MITDYIAEHGPVYGMAGASGAPVIACGHRQGVVVVRDFSANHTTLIEGTAYDQGISRLSLTRLGERLCVAGFAGGVECYDTISGRLLWADRTLEETQHIEAVSELGLCAAASDAGTLVLLRISDGDRQGSVVSAQDFAFSADGTVLLAAGPKSLVLRRTTDWGIGAEFPRTRSATPLTFVATSPTHSLLVDLRRHLQTLNHADGETGDIVSGPEEYWDGLAASSCAREFLGVTRSRAHNSTRSLYRIDAKLGSTQLLLANLPGQGHACIVDQCRQFVHEYESPQPILR